MRIVCPSCASPYDIADERVGSGRSVRCARCRTVWFAAPDAPGAGHEPTPANAFADSPDPAPPAGEGLEGGAYNWTFELEDQLADGAAETPAASESPDLDESQSPEPPPDPLPLSGPLIVPDAPALAPALEQEHAAEPSPPPPEPTVLNADVESLAARRPRRVSRRRRPSRAAALPLAVIGFAAVLAGLLLWRKDIVRLAPQTAPLYGAIGLPVNLRGLVFENVRTTRETSDGVGVLIVEGTIVSVSSRTVEVPRLRFGVRNAAGLEVYAWTSVPARTILPPGETIEFRSRLASPPADGRDVVVRFFNRRDLVAGLR
jgi:predicted Zn finger-like uncharacterized protein